MTQAATKIKKEEAPKNIQNVFLTQVTKGLAKSTSAYEKVKKYVAHKIGPYTHELRRLRAQYALSLKKASIKLGAYSHKFDCYDFVTAVLFAVKNQLPLSQGTTLLALVRGHGWNPSMSIYQFGYKKAPTTSQNDLREGDIVKVRSPFGTGNSHWGIAARDPEDGEIYILHRGNDPTALKDKPKDFCTNGVIAIYRCGEA